MNNKYSFENVKKRNVRVRGVLLKLVFCSCTTLFESRTCSRMFQPYVISIFGQDSESFQNWE